MHYTFQSWVLEGYDHIYVTEDLWSLTTFYQFRHAEHTQSTIQSGSLGSLQYTFVYIVLTSLK